METTVTFTLDQFQQVYSGKDGRCCCGCSGKHYTAADKGWAAMGAKVMRLLNDPANGAEDNGDHVSVVLDGRLYIGYRKEA